MEEPQEGQYMTNRELMRDMHGKVTKMYHVVYGDSSADVPGVAQRVKTLEEKDKKRSGMYMMISAISAGMTLAIKAFTEKF